MKNQAAEALKEIGTPYPDGELCFCQMAVGNPMVKAHSDKCFRARAALASIEQAPSESLVESRIQTVLDLASAYVHDEGILDEGQERIRKALRPWLSVAPSGHAGELREVLEAFTYQSRAGRGRRKLMAHHIDALVEHISPLLHPDSVEPVGRFLALVREHSFPIRDPKQERVPDGSGWIGKLYLSPTGELVVTDGAPKELPDDHPLAHNCDEMGCSSVSHVIARLVPSTGEKP